MGILTIEGSSVAKRGWVLVALAVVGAVLVWQRSRPETSVRLGQWTEIVAVAPRPAEVDWPSIDAYPLVEEALSDTNPERLREAMQEVGLRGLWVGVTPGASEDPELPLERRFAAGGIVRGFRGAVLTAEGLLYVIEETEWPVVLCDRILARVARGILQGSTPPPLDAFPTELTKPQGIEVMVLLTSGLGPRLWRSARAQSIADGVITAALAARQRWEERMETMGGPLGDRLDDLDVQVAFLFDDGTFDRDALSLIDALVKPRHGVAYEQPTRWRYLLPRATHNAETPTDAYRQLFRDNGLPEDSFERRDLRLYRMLMRTVSVNHGSAGSSRTGVPSGLFD
jgi:hypothetical protein